MTIFQDNHQLLDAFRNGDDGALTAVYLHYVDEIERYVSRRTRDVELRRDLLQTIFERAFKPSSRLAYDGIHPYRAYLFRIAHNAVIDQWRSRSHEHIAYDEEDLDQVSPLDYQPSSLEESIHWRRLVAASRDYRSKLDAHSKAFMHLRFEQQLPQLEVAQKLKISRWKVRSLEAKLLRGLKKYLRKQRLTTEVSEIETPEPAQRSPLTTALDPK